LHRNTEAKAGLVVARTAIWPAPNHPSSPELQLVYDTAPIGLAFLTPDCRYVLINQRLTEICGISITEHIGRSVRETVPQVADQVELIVRTVVDTGVPIIGVEISGQHPDNADRFWTTHWHPLKDCEGRVVGINVAAEEITERKRAQAALLANEQELRQLADTLSERVAIQARERDRIWNVTQDVFAVADADGRIRRVNPAWTTTLGWPESDVVGKTPESLGAKRHNLKIVCAVAMANTRGFHGGQCSTRTPFSPSPETSRSLSMPKNSCGHRSVNWRESRGRPQWVQ
jgi:PAS domain S-box-containing protein